MEKSKRKILIEIKKQKLKEAAKKAAKKLAALWVITSMVVVNIPTGFTMAAFVDQEATSNSVVAGTLDAQMTALADFAPAVKPAINATKDIDLSNLGSLGFKYNIKSGNLAGDLCSNLSLKADLDGTNKYTGPIENFSVDIADFSDPEKWHFEASMETDNYSLQGKTCTLDFLVLAKQKDLLSGVGFSDDETMANVINAGTWTLKGVWIQTTIADFNAGVSSLYNGVKEILVTPATDGTGDAQIATGGVIPPVIITSAKDGDNKHLPPLAIDGDTTTFWKGTNSKDSWLQIDLGQNYPIERIRMVFDNGNKTIDKYILSISQTGAFAGEETVVATEINNTLSDKTYTFAPIEGRYVRFTIQPMNGNPWVYEFQVLKRELPAFDGVATLTSQTFNSDKITKWTTLEWDETLLTGTDINFSVQTSNDGSTWSPWQLKAGTSPIDLSSLPQTRYIRWEAELTTNTLTPPISTPVLHEARVYYEQENAQYNLVMNEFLPNPEGLLGSTDFGQDTDLAPKGEWIEIYNNSTSKIDLAGFYFKNSADSLRTINAIRTNTGSTVIDPGSWLVFYTGQEGSPEFMSNTGDTLTFYDLWGNIIDTYTYTGLVDGNKSYARIPDGTGAWVDPIPTPGTANIVEEEQTFLTQLIETVTSTIAAMMPENTTTTEPATSTPETSESPAIPSTSETPVEQEPATVQEETPAPEEPAITPEEPITQVPAETPVQEEPAITPQDPVQQPAPEAVTEAPAPESNPSSN